MRGRLLTEASPSFDLLFKVLEDRRVEEVPQGDVQSVAELFDGGHGGGVVAPADDVVDRGLGHAADGGQPVDGDPPLPAQVQDPLPDGRAGIHRLTS